MRNGKNINWQHLVDLYEEEIMEEVGIRLMQKLKFEYIKLTPFSKMRVDFAA